jgi:hypothetical protein
MPGARPVIEIKMQHLCNGAADRKTEVKKVVAAILHNQLATGGAEFAHEDLLGLRELRARHKQVHVVTDASGKTLEVSQENRGNFSHA